MLLASTPCPGQLVPYPQGSDGTPTPPPFLLHAMPTTPQTASPPDKALPALSP